ncbi:MAG: hypothetical protein LN588_04800 [Rickettsia endosymbiont of Bryobia graminum]|nr:hypothetical protein [Rickettsia endosymbiont of Bryobia graminum]
MNGKPVQLESQNNLDTKQADNLQFYSACGTYLNWLKKWILQERKQNMIMLSNNFLSLTNFA